MSAQSVADAIGRTLRDAAEAGLTDPSDRAALLPLIFEAHLGGATRATNEDPTKDNNPARRDTDSGEGSLAKIGTWLGVAPEEIEMCFGDAGDGPQVTVSPRRLATSKADATRQLAQLVLAMRQGAGLDEYTSVSEIRSVVADYGKHDPSNFAAHLGVLDAVASSVGKGGAKKLKVTRVGRDRIAELVRELGRGE